ncbi:uncharacterized protein METZ01_LOCUS488095, partial [marine metagenome]
MRLMKTFFPIALLGVVLAAQQALAAFKPTDWPAWRGLHGDGHAKAVKGLPVKWSDSKNVVWKIKLPGRGHSTPTIVGNR